MWQLASNVVNKTVRTYYGSQNHSPYFDAEFITWGTDSECDNAFALQLVSGMGAESFRLLELSVGGKGASEEENNGGRKQVLLSVGGDGRVVMAGGGGVLLEEGDLEVSGGGAAFKV